jgi:hypothetical protein
LREPGSHNHRDGEGDECEVGDDVHDAHGQELGVALPAFRARVWNYLPVVGEGLASGEVADYCGDECHSQKYVQVPKQFLVRPLPD